MLSTFRCVVLTLVGALVCTALNVSVSQHSAVNLALREEIKTADVILCSIVKNEKLYIDEWLLYHKYLGFDRAHLYDNADNASVYLNNLPNQYGDYVRVVHLPGLGKQKEAYLKCMNDHAHSNTWGAFIDIDEFIVLRKHPNIKSLLHELAPDGGSVVLGWNIFGSSGAITREPGPVLARFTMTSVVPDRHVKTVAYLPHALDPIIHNVILKPGHPTVDQHGRAISCDSPYVENNDRKVAHINHYYTKSWEEFQAKRQRGWASSYRLNHLVVGGDVHAKNRMAHDFKCHNRFTNAVEDTFARDFYLRHLPVERHVVLGACS